jgi:hypothetical protein
MSIRILSLVCLLATSLAACGGKKDPGGPSGSAPPPLILGVGTGLPAMSAGDHRLEVSVGNPLGPKFGAPGGDTIEPGLLPQAVAE